MTQTRPWFRKEPGARRNALAKCLFIFLQGEGFAPAGATKGLSDRPLETLRGPCLRALLRAKEAKGFSSAVQLERGRAPVPCGAGRARLSKTFGRCRGAAPPTFIRVSRLCRRTAGFSNEKPSRFATAVFLEENSAFVGLLILLAKSILPKFGRPLVDRICFLEKVASATFRLRRCCRFLAEPGRVRQSKSVVVRSLFSVSTA